MAPLANSIGIISCITYEQSFKGRFEAAVKQTNPNVNIKPSKDQKGYKQADLQQAVTDFCQAPDGPVGLIVTLGGMAAYNAANAVLSSASHSAVRFISLVGEVPPTSSNKCFGGVSLESFAHNADRVTYLQNTIGIIGNGSISLYQNQNSEMAGDETGSWQTLADQNAQLVKVLVPAMLINGTNNDTNYAQTVPTIQSQAVIVSADPYFQQTRNSLIQAFKNWIGHSNRYVVYPLKNYTSAGNNTAVIGPSIEDAMTKLGQIAAAALNTGTSQGFSKQPLATHKKR